MLPFALLALLQVPAAPHTLQAAVDAARPGDTIHVTPGVHRGLLVIDRPLVLTGPADAILDGERQGTVLTIRSDSVTILGISVRGSGRALEQDMAAIKLERCHGCRISHVTITDPLHGVYLLESHGIELADNRITGATDLAESSRGNGIHLFNSTGNRLLRNSISGTRDGMYFSFATHNLVEGNSVSGVRYGLHYMYSDDNRFESNSFRRNAAGAAIMFSQRIIFRGNIFSEHVGYRAYGILLQTASQVLAENNRIEGNLTGLFLDGATVDTFRNNLVRGNGVGIDVLASAENNVFAGNVIADNRIAVRKVLGTSANAWSLDGRGNYWKDAAVFDLDRDGIGDRPYQAGDPFAGLAADKPALDIFSGTLAARALAWADEAFPVFDLPRVTDPHPLARPPAWLEERPTASPVAVSSTRTAAWWAIFPVVPAALVLAARRRQQRAA
ncbi:MAG TPA: nitrous oxide reductase family maturation protein NosD [Gemmatimonadales bacterium]|nr:nitrous oxide reductase family maturation protein NosD [Gemmatimonadales bacterium]